MRGPIRAGATGAKALNEATGDWVERLLNPAFKHIYNKKVNAHMGHPSRPVKFEWGTIPEPKKRNLSSRDAAYEAVRQFNEEQKASGRSSRAR